MSPLFRDVSSETTSKHADATTTRAEWCRLLHPDLLLDLVLSSLISGLPLLLPTHTRPLPMQSPVAGVPPVYSRAFHLDQPYVADTVSNGVLMAIISLLPLCCELIISLVAPVRGAVKASFQAYIWTMGLQLLIVSSLKSYCGYWRPYFLSECGFNATLAECTEAHYEHAYRSFPSGHSATSLGVLLLVSLRLIGAAQIGHVSRRVALTRRVSVAVDGLLLLLALTPVLLGCWISASRVYDNAHHPADVVGGGVIGVASALLYHGRYFHPSFGPDAYRPREEHADAPSAAVQAL